jgi:hypothetical protein
MQVTINDMRELMDICNGLQAMGLQVAPGLLGYIRDTVETEKDGMCTWKGVPVFLARNPPHGNGEVVMAPGLEHADELGDGYYHIMLPDNSIHLIRMREDRVIRISWWMC